MRINNYVYKRFTELGIKSVLSREKEEMYLFCFKHGILREESRRALVNGSMWVVVVNVLKLCSYYSLPEDIIGELLHEGYIVLNDCLDSHYNPIDHGARFSSYAYSRVSGVLRHWLRDNEVCDTNILSLNAPVQTRVLSDKKCSRAMELEVQDILTDEYFEKNILRKIDMAVFWDRLSKYIGKDKAVLLSAYYGYSDDDPVGLEYREISSMLGGISINTLKWRIYRALSCIRKSEKATEVVRDAVL